MATETTLESLQLDSLDTLVLAMGLEDALNIEIRVVDLPKNRTISELADYVAGFKEQSMKIIIEENAMLDKGSMGLVPAV